MAYRYLDTLATPSVRAVQASMGSERLWSVAGQDRDFDRLTANEAAFIGQRDSFYIATVSESGWPYVQHRGGPPGFLKVLDDRTLAFADYRGNRQYVSVGNLTADDRASLILVDYVNRARLKILAHLAVVPLGSDAALEAVAVDRGYGARPERILKLTLVAFDWNCPQHIAPRFTEAEIAPAIASLRQRIAILEAENARLRAESLGAGEA